MAPPSPRRSSRARIPQSTPSQPSSMSSGASGRPDRNTRSAQKSNSSGKSTPSASLSSEPPDDHDTTLLGRRRKRNAPDDYDQPSRPNNFDMSNGSDDPQEEEDEAVRCICGSEEYPGPPPSDAPDADFFLQHELTEDVTGFFVQCDVCQVWQHGACVGIFSAESSPEEYFCELCRKDYHKIHTASNGQNYSRYLPTQQRFSRAQSRAVSSTKEEPRTTKASGGKHTRSESMTQLSKRRSTMNSRDAAYDDEILRRVIEASKDEADPDGTEGPRRPKRGRSDSDEQSNTVKRQRTNSRSASPPAPAVETASPRDSDDDSGSVALKKTRSSRSQMGKSEKDEKERQRQEAANKRKGRAERRRADADSDMSEETPPDIPTAPAARKSPEPPATKESSPVEPPTVGTPPPVPATTSSSHKRGARSHQKKAKMRSQQSKDQEKEESPARSMSRDVQRNEETAGASTTKSGATSVGSALAAAQDPPKAKAKPVMPARMSMLDMKRRVGAIMDFISRTQVDLAAEASLSSSSSGKQTPRPAGDGNNVSNGTAAHDELLAQQQQQDDALQANLQAGATDKTFSELTCMEMMDALTRDMVKWQNTYT